MIIDTHVHLNFADFNDDYMEIIKECLKNEIFIINVGTNYKTSKKAIEIAKKFDFGVYASIGLHPVHTVKRVVSSKETGRNSFKSSGEIFNYEKYKKLCENKKVIAIGETGLDYYWRAGNFENLKKIQIETFKKEIELGKELNLPIIMHCRVAYKDLLKNIEKDIKGVVHCFTGEKKYLRKLLDLGFYIGFNGIIFKKIKGIDFNELIKFTPIENILLETDSPYLTPPNFHEKRNNPLSIKIIAERIAEIKNMDLEDLLIKTFDNAKNLFENRQCTFC